MVRIWPLSDASRYGATRPDASVSPRRSISSLSARASELFRGLAAGQFGEACANRARLAGSGECAGDGAETLVCVGARHVGHSAQKLVAAEPDDQVVRAEVLGDQRDDALEQSVAGVVTCAVVTPFQSDNVDVDDHERAACPATAVDFVFKFGQARRSGACPGQRVDLGDRKRASERLAICERLQAVAGALLAVARCGFAVPGGSRSDARRLARGSPWRACAARRRA